MLLTLHRFGLVRVREHAEEIAFYRGEKGEEEGIKGLLERVGGASGSSSTTRDYHSQPRSSSLISAWFIGGGSLVLIKASSPSESSGNTVMYTCHS